MSNDAHSGFNLFIGKPGDTPESMKPFGTVQAISMMTRTGRMLYMGSAEAVFDLKLTFQDKQLLEGMNIKL